MDTLQVEPKGEAKVAVIGNDNQELVKRLARLNGLVKNADPLKVARFIGKNLSENVKFNSFMSSDFDAFLKKVPAKFRSMEAAHKVVGQLAEGDGLLINVEKQKTALAGLCKELVDVELGNKTTWLQSFNLDAELEAKAAKQLDLYRRALMTAIQTSTVYKKYYGVEE